MSKMRAGSDRKSQTKIHRHRRAGQKCSAYSAALWEALEPRQLMSVDLSGAFTLFPAAALSGSSPSVTVHVTNTGANGTGGAVVVDFYAALDGVTFDKNTAKFLGRTSRAALGANGAENVNYLLPLSAALAAGNYRVYALLDPDGKISESNENNNTVQSDVLGIVQPNYDLTASFGGTASLPPAIVAGTKVNATLPVAITNPGSSTVSLPVGQQVAVQIVARPVGAVNELQDIILNTHVVNAAVGGLAPGKTRTVNVAIQFPANLAANDYDIVAKVDTGGALAETNESNNESTFVHAVNVANVFSDPSLAFHTGVTIPANVVADGRALPLKFDVTNMGNQTIPAGATGSVLIVAHNISLGTDTPLQTFTVSLGGLGSGKIKTIPLTPSIVANLADGNYVIDATLTTTLSGDLGGNNAVTSVGTMNVGPAFFNIATTAPTTLIAPAILGGATVPGSVNVGITNASNTFLPTGTKATIAMVLRPAGQNNNLNDIPIGHTSVGLGGLAIGGTLGFHVSVTIPATLPNGDPVPLANYNIVSIVTPTALAETTVSDNTAVGDAIEIAAPFTDLAITSASTNFPVPSSPGTTAIGSVVVRNTGNLSMKGTVKIQYIATSTGDVNDGFFIGSDTFSLDLFPGQSSIPLNSSLTLTTPTNGFNGTQYTVYARIDPSSFVDANAGNNQRVAGAMTVSTQHVDLRIISATNPYASSVGPNATGTGQVIIGNFGSGISSGQVTITYYVSSGTTLDGSESVIGTQTVMVTLGAAQLTTPTSVSLTMVNSPAAETLNILVKITATADVDNNPDDNLTTVIGTVNYQGIGIV